MKTLFCLLTTLILCSSANARTVKGTVTDALTLRPIVDAQIYVNGIPTDARSDAQGKFQVEVYNGQKVSVYKSNYENKEITIGFGQRKIHVYMWLYSYWPVIEKTEITALAEDRPRPESSGPVRRLYRSTTAQAERGSVANALNSVAGVKMEERGLGGSRRISIRGSIMRSPFGVRNLKAYWNGMPLTQADGSTPMEVIDPIFISTIDVLKGPSGSIYGAGNGGVLLIGSGLPSYSTNSIFAAHTMGSFGYHRTTISAHAANIGVGYVRQRIDGYRDHESNRKDQFNFSALVKDDGDERITVSGLFFDGRWELPGSLDSAQLAVDRTSANAYSVAGNAAVKKVITRASLHYNKKMKPWLDYDINFFAGSHDKENPYGTSNFFNGYKSESGFVTGLRTALDLHAHVGSIFLEGDLGVEQQFQMDRRTLFDNNNGFPDAIRADGKNQFSNGIYFAQVSAATENGWRSVLGMSYNKVRYRQQDLFLTDSIDLSGTVNFDPVVTPRIALVKSFGKAIHLRGSLGYGFSPPTSWEVIRDNGTIDDELEPEKVMNVEAGANFQINSPVHKVQIALYRSNYSNMIIPGLDTSGVVDYTNTDRAIAYGLEVEINGRIHGPKDHWEKNFDIQPWCALTLQDYRFSKGEFSGNLVPGISGMTLASGIAAAFRKDYQLRTGLWYWGPMELDQANTAQSVGAVTWNFSGTYRMEFMRYRIRANISGGVNNILNSRYTSFHSINDPGRRFFNPTAGRNYFLRLEVYLNGA